MITLYETTIVIDPQLKSTEIEDTIKKVTNFITNNGGEIVKVEEWGKRRLAYEIHKKQYGYYVHIRFKAPGQLIRLLEREYRLSEAILRYLTIKVHKLALKMEEEQIKKGIAAAAELKEAEEKLAEAAAANQAEETAEETADEAAEETVKETAEETTETVQESAMPIAAEEEGEKIPDLQEAPETGSEYTPEVQEATDTEPEANKDLEATDKD